MSWRPLRDEEVDDLLRSQRIVRVAFSAEDVPYVLALGYVWVERALWGTTRIGRKTRNAGANPRVAFAVDDSASSVPFHWRSCVGKGRFEVVGVDEFAATAGATMASVSTTTRHGTEANGSPDSLTVRRSAGGSH